MSVKIIIQRKFKKTPVPENFQVINKLRKGAIHQEGYVTGETLVDFENNFVVVLSTWASFTAWKRWSGCPERAELENELTPHLKKPLKIKQYITAADYRKEVLKG